MTAADQPATEVLALCPECRDVHRGDRFEQNAVRCSDCNVSRRVALITHAGRREPLLTEDALYHRLHAIAESRNGQVGRRYLEQAEPALLANCRAHAGSYRGARRRLRRWLGRHRGSPPAATEAEAFPFWSAREEDDPLGDDAIFESRGSSSDTAQIAALALQVRSRAPSLDDRCPYCHDVFEDADNDGQPDHAFLCDCGALFHVECRVELERCTTLGCEAAFEPAARGRPEISVVLRGSDEAESALTFTPDQASTVGNVITAVAAVAVMVLIYTIARSVL